MRSSWVELLARQVSPQSLAFFRIALGCLLALDSATYLWPGDRGNHVWIDYTGPHIRWLFTYHGFSWVHPWPEPWMSVHFAAYGLAGLALALGLCSRSMALLAGVLYGYVFLLDETHYNNHYYLTVLLCFLLATMPAGAAWSIDRWLVVRRLRIRGQAIAPPRIPFWPIALLRLQWFIVYFYAGLTKLSPSWLLYGQPIRTWLADPSVEVGMRRVLSVEQVAGLLPIVHSPEFAILFSYAGLLFDLVIGFLLLARRTRILGITLALGFHATNHLFLFDDIAWFPLIASLLTTIFLDPDWPSRLTGWLRRPRLAPPDWQWLLPGALLLPGVGALLGWNLRPTATTVAASKPLARWLVAAIAIYVVFQLFWPLRHLLIPGDVNWTDEGERFAWRMKASHKVTTPLSIDVVDPGLIDLQRTDGVDWNAWRGAKVLYQDVDAGGIDFRRLPEVFVELSPFCGERVIYNPWSEAVDQSRSFDDSVARVQALWQQTYGRPPTLYTTFPLVTVLDAAAAQLGEAGLGPSAFEELAQARAAAMQLARGNSRAEDAALGVKNLHRRLERLIGDPRPTISRTLRRFLGQAAPFATEGGPAADGGFLVVEDLELLVAISRVSLAMLDRNRWRLAWDQAHWTYGDFSDLPEATWRGLPEVLPIRRSDGTLRFAWNAQAELTRQQFRVCGGRPFMCHQYAQHVAQRWQERFGRRPRVYVKLWASLVPYLVQPCIDPEADLAAAPLRLFWHSDWIMPLTTLTDESVLSSASDGPR